MTHRLDIDLSAVPSGMEALAASWKGKGSPPAPMQPKVKPKGHQTFAKAEVPVVPERPARPRIQQEALRGQNKMAQGNGKWIFRHRGSEIDFPTEQALADYIAELRALSAPPEPDPAQYAMTLPPHIARALVRAFRCPDSEFAGHLEVERGHHEAEMFALGLTMLIGPKKRLLSRFGVLVRKEVMQDVGFTK